MSFWFLVFIQVLPISILIYLYINRKYSCWSRIGVAGPKPSLLQLGNLFQLSGSTNQSLSEPALVKRHGRIYGTFAGLQPVLTVADSEWIKRIMVKDFHLFINRRELRTYHKYVNSALFFTENDDWKRLRSITSPTFSSGKLRAMHSLMDQCIDKLNSYLTNLVTNGDGVMDTKEVIAGFTLDVIASTSFALETNSNGDRAVPNPFLEHSMNMTQVSPLRALSFLAMPKWFNRLVKVEHFLNDDSVKYFQELTAEVLKQRRASNAIKRNDLMQLLIDASADDNELANTDYTKLEADIEKNEIENPEKISKKNTMTDTEIIAQSMLFLSAGFETTTATISNCIFELSQNASIQERLFQELTKQLGGIELNSDQYLDIVMRRLPYLDAVIKETLRKYPPLTRLERRVSADGYQVNGISLRKNQLVEISTIAVHYDPEYYPEPHQFNPDRFMPSNKHLLVPYTFLPFGVGPRNCVGLRFAYQEIKLCLSQIVRQFRFSPTAQTPEKLEYENFKIALSVKPFPTKVELR